MEITIGANVKFHNNGRYLFGIVTRIWGPKANRQKYVTIKSHSGKTFVRYYEDVSVMEKLTCHLVSCSDINCPSYGQLFHSSH